MKITLQAVRMYGSKDQYGQTPLSCPSNGPIILDNFPGKRERSLIFLGAPPESVLIANKVRKAIGIVALGGIFGKAPNPEVERDILIKRKLGELTDSPKVSDYNWYITIIVEREVDVTNADIANSEFLWLNLEKSLEKDKEFESYASQHIDLLATYASTIIEPTFFEKVVIDDHVFFSAAGRESFGLPCFSSSGNFSTTRSMESLNSEKLKQLLQNVAVLPQNRHQWLNTIKHWRLTAIREKDPWKRFLWNFLALEVLTHELADMLYAEVISNLCLRVRGQSDIESGPIPISELVRDKKRLPLRAKFAIVALGLFPDSATADVEDFIKAKDARDKLSHGALKEAAELPISTVSALLEKYLAGAVKFQLKL